MKFKPNFFGQAYFYFRNDSLFNNSVYLILATVVMAGFGFFFWLINARLFSTEDIGLATTLISVMNMIAIFSLMGFDAALVRFLPGSQKKDDQVNTAFILVGAAAFILSSLFLILVPSISYQISFIRSNFFMAFSFVFFCITSALNMLAESVFVADRQTKFIFTTNSFFSFIKMILPFTFIGFGAFGVFAAAGITHSIGLLMCVWIMVRKSKYHLRLGIDRNVINLLKKYCFANYFAGALNLLPATLLPIIVLNNIGKEEAAYYYVIMMIANLLYVIPQATTKSLFAESSHDEQSIIHNVKKSLKIIGVLLLPGMLFLIICGGWLLLFFGKDYSAGGIDFLYLTVLASIPVTFYYLLTSLFRIRKDLWALIITEAVYMFVIIGASCALISYGLVGIGIAWILGNLAASIAGGFMYFRKRRKYSLENFVS